MKKEIMQALNELNIAFYDFKSANDKKIADLEQNTAGSLVNEKLKNLDTDILNLEKKLKKMELKRPDFETENSCGNSENDREFKSYLLSGVKKSLNECKSSVMLENNNAYQAPGYIVDNINASLDAQSVIRRYARRIKTSASAAELILHTKNPDAGWVDNGRNSGEYDANIEFRKVKIPVHEIYARPRTTKSMIEDSVQNVEEWIVNATVDQIANVENHAFWFGNGENQPTGIFYYPRSESGVFDNETKTFQEFRGDTDGISGEGISVDMLVDVVLSLKPKYLSKARWIMPRSVLAVIRKMKDKDGRYIWQPTLNMAENSTLLGYPIDICDDLVSSDQNGPLMVFGNLQETYTIVDREEISIIRDPFSLKPFVEFYVTKRVGGDVTNFDALKIVTLGGNE